MRNGSKLNKNASEDRFSSDLNIRTNSEKNINYNTKKVKKKNFSIVGSCILLLLLILLCELCAILFGVISKVNISLNASEFEITKDSFTFENEKILAEMYVAPVFNTNDLISRFTNARAMVMGDSTAEGLFAYGVIGSDNVVYTRGRTIQYSTADLPAVVAKKPDYLFLAYGANDLLSWRGNITGYINSYKNIVTEIRSQLPNTKICINCVLPVSDTALAGNSDFGYQQQYNEALKSFCDSEGILFIDNVELLDQTPDGRKYESDGIHPRPFYYKLWAANMAKSIDI